MSTDQAYVAAHEHSSWHRRKILDSSICGCFYCLRIYPPGEIVEWVDDHDGVGQTALCPYCGIDSVIGSASGNEVTTEFLLHMHEHWF